MLYDCDEVTDLGNGIGIDWSLIPAGDDPLGRYTLTNDFYMMTSIDQIFFRTTYILGTGYEPLVFCRKGRALFL